MALDRAAFRQRVTEFFSRTGEFVPREGLKSLLIVLSELVTSGDTAIAKAAARVATTANITLSGLQTIDGIALALYDRVLVKDQTAAEENGIYIALDGAWLRAGDANDADRLVPNFTISVSEGTANADTFWTLTTDSPITVDTTSLTFELVQGSGGAPVAHAATHEDGGGDEIDVTGLSGLLADAQTPTVHAASHKSAGGDEIDGDQLDIDLVPANYTPDTGPAIVTSSQHLSAHLAGIDNALGAGGTTIHGTTSNKSMTAAVTAFDEDPGTATPVAATPVNDGYVRVLVNGIGVEVGDGTKVGVESYFSSDGGTTPRAIADIAAGDTWHWNGSVSGYELDALDKIDWDYLTT